jgi:hypothetical protein
MLHCTALVLAFAACTALSPRELEVLGVVSVSAWAPHAPSGDRGSDRFAWAPHAPVGGRGPDRPSTTDSLLPLALAVSHRETVFGCHSFDRFLDPRWETFFLFAREFATAWQLRSLAARAFARSLSGGATVVEWDSIPPQPRSRALVLRLLAERDVTVASLVACSCDVHALPSWHVAHVPFRTLVTQLYNALVADSASRRLRGGSKAEYYPRVEMRKWNARAKATDKCMRRFERQRTRPLLAVCALLVETLPASDSLVGARLHGDAADVGNWSARGFQRRPSHVLGGGEQWLTDTAVWVCDRMCAYNASLLVPALRRMHFIEGTIADAPRVWSAVACEQNLAAVRSNDVIGWVDRAHEGLVSRAPAVDGLTEYVLYNSSVYTIVPFAWLKPYALWVLAQQAAPHVCLSQLALLRARAGLEADLHCATAAADLRPEHLPPPALNCSSWAAWAGAEAAAACTGEGPTIRESLALLVRPLLELVGHRLAQINSTHASFVLVPTFGACPLFTLRGGRYTRRALAAPWLQTAGQVDHGEQLAVRFAGRRLGERAVFFARAIGRTQPVAFALELDARISRIEAPLSFGGRASRVPARAWLLLVQQLCDTELRLGARESRAPSGAGGGPGPHALHELRALFGQACDVAAPVRFR